MILSIENTAMNIMRFDGIGFQTDFANVYASDKRIMIQPSAVHYF